MTKMGDSDFYLNSFLNQSFDEIQDAILSGSKDVNKYIVAAQQAFEFLQSTQETGEKHTAALQKANDKLKKLNALESTLFENAIHPLQPKPAFVQPSFLPSISSKPQEAPKSTKPQISEAEQKLSVSDRRSLWKKASGYEEGAYVFYASMEEGSNAAIRAAVRKFERAAVTYIKAGDFEKAFQVRAFAAASIKFSDSHVLHDLSKSYDARNEKMMDKRFGDYFSRLGGVAVKGGCLHIIKRKVLYMGKITECYCLDFKLTVPTRNNLGMTLKAIEKDKALFIKCLPADLAKSIKISKGEFVFKTQTKDYYSDVDGFNTKAQTMNFEFGQSGRVVVCNDEGWDCLYNCITMEVPVSGQEGENLQDLFQMLNVIGLGEVMTYQSKMDVERMKIAILFRTYFPEIATPLERESKYYETSPEELRAHIIKECPQMEVVFKRYFYARTDLLKLDKIFPFRPVWAVSDISQKMRDNGALGLTFGILGSFERGCEKLIPVLSSGALSSQDRCHSGIVVKGLSSTEDLQMGSGDQVFTRLMTDKFVGVAFSKFPLKSAIHVLCDLDVVNFGSYGYPADCFGGQAGIHADTYANRENLIEFAKRLDGSDTFNEVMVKHRIAPKFFLRVVVSTREEKESLIKIMGQKGLLDRGEDSKYYFQGKPVEDFIYVSKTIDREMWGYRDK